MPASIKLVWLNNWYKNVLSASSDAVLVHTIYYETREKKKSSQKFGSPCLCHLVHWKEKNDTKSYASANTLKFIHWKLSTFSSNLERWNVRMTRTHCQAFSKLWIARQMETGPIGDKLGKRSKERMKSREREKERKGWEQEHNCRAQVKALS